ncbi:MAG: hypothetical protein MUP63_04340, partial [Candidatus Nanohaloarchaeota archaeon QJJ-7]|nr:hypothetical protein [Candidatus Nanohaloarchaeota archaeon QJJ-7]
MSNHHKGGRDPEHPQVPDDTKPTDEPAGYQPEKEDPGVGSPGSIGNSTHPFYSLEIVPAIKNEVG